MNSFLKELEQQYNDIYFNEEQLEKIDKKIKQISGIQERFKENSIKDAMHIYINELIPEIKNLENLKYGTREMIESTLWQKPYRLSQLDYTFGSLPKVIKFKTTI
jgi:molecular chaperone GrpE (heat shock protein)